jgi:hypothetical protein
MFNDADDFFETSAQGGKTYRFKDIDGIGPATAKKIKNVRRKRGNVQNPDDVADMSADELSDKAGISRDRAAKAIKGGGGNPNVSKQSNAGSVSAAGIQQAQGDFMVGFSELDKARARNDVQSRSEEAVRQDDQKRAPVTTNYDKWKQSPGQWDFPGVDTPTQEPNLLPKDLKAGNPDTTDFDARDEREQERKQQSFPQKKNAASGKSNFILQTEDERIPASDETAEARGIDEFGVFAEARDVSLSPDEAFQGVGLGSPSAPGGQAYNAILGRPVETDRIDQEQEPSDSALRRQQRTQDEGIAGADTRGADIAFVYQNEGQDTDLSLSEFRDRTKRVGRKLGLEGDAFGNAQMVAYDEDVNEKF